MKKYIIFIWLILFSTSVNADDNAVLLQKAEQSLNQIRTLSTDFTQTSSQQNERISGHLQLVRPNKMLLTYDKPEMPRIIADGYSLIYIEDYLEQVTYLGLDSTPAFFVLQDELSFDDEKILVKDITLHNGNLYISIAMKDYQLSGEVTLVFKEKDYTLLGWTITDAKRIRTNIVLKNPIYNAFIDEKIFDFINPYNNKKKQPFLKSI